MERYIHTLIATDSDFAPQPDQVATFFVELMSQTRFHPIPNKSPSLPSLAVAKPSGQLRWMTNPMTGGKIAFLHYDRWDLGEPEAISSAIENAGHYTVMQSGEWPGQDRPILLLKTDGTAFNDPYICTVRCELRPEPVSTSAWDIEAGLNLRQIPDFGSTCTNKTQLGIFPNPWTGAVIEVPNAGCARFWIEFEFGRFVYPQIRDNSLAVLDSVVVSWAERCFGTQLVQGCRFW